MRRSTRACLFGALAASAGCAPPPVAAPPQLSVARARPALADAPPSSAPSPAVPPGGATVALAMNQDGPVVTLFVPVTVDGKLLRLMLDTGSTTSSLTPGAVAELGLVADGSQTVVAVAGGTMTVSSVQVPRVAVGEVELRDVAMNVADIGSGDGLLGLDVLTQMVFELDLNRRELHLYPNGSTRWHGDDLIAVPYTSAFGGLIEVDAALAGAPVTAVIDSGTSPSIANPRAVPHPLDIETGVHGDDGHVIPARVAGGSPAVAVGGITLAPGLVYVADA
ncbi:MAG TPA: retropepsin-like aspartic protease, partial [Kofleriaceae bacterium]|nr:retropepsin-like aspartic protease [Kofleriaceae bacterium]